jgi:hypothetical protein
VERSLGIAGGINGTYRDLLNRRADYALLANHRTHDFRSYGTFELPFGPGKLLARNSSGWMARLIEGWQFGAIFTVTSGAPLNVVGQNTIYTMGTPDIVGDFPRKGHVVGPLKEGDIFGGYFDQQYQRVADPACASVASNLTQWCTTTALADASGNIVLRMPGLESWARSAFAASRDPEDGISTRTSRKVSGWMSRNG